MLTFSNCPLLLFPLSLLLCCCYLPPWTTNLRSTNSLWPRWNFFGQGNPILHSCCLDLTRNTSWDKILGSLIKSFLLISNVYKHIFNVCQKCFWYLLCFVSHICCLKWAFTYLLLVLLLYDKLLILIIDFTLCHILCYLCYLCILFCINF